MTFALLDAIHRRLFASPPNQSCFISIGGVFVFGLLALYLDAYKHEKVALASLAFCCICLMFTLYHSCRGAPEPDEMADDDADGNYVPVDPEAPTINGLNQ